METTSKIRGIRKRPQQVGRRTGGTAKQTGLRTAGNATDGFLKHSFTPLYEQGQNLPNRCDAESGFFKSLSILSAQYGIPVPEVSGKQYPYNILLAHRKMQDELKRMGQEITLFIVQQEQGSICLATDNRYSTGTTLYYIPIMPLYRLLQDKKQKRTAELLLSVFAYLYHVAGIPYYRDDYSALSYYYECMEDWLSEDWGAEEESEQYEVISQYNCACYYGDVMLRKIFNPYHLNHFRERIATYKATTPFEYGCLRLARTALSMMERYPNCKIFRNTENEQLQQDEDDMIIRAEQYISFVADTEGLLYQNIAQMINSEFGECGEMEQPTLHQTYDDQTSTAMGSLDFEYEIFPLILNLCTLLYELP